MPTPKRVASSVSTAKASGLSPADEAVAVGRLEGRPVRAAPAHLQGDAHGALLEGVRDGEHVGFRVIGGQLPLPEARRLGGDPAGALARASTGELAGLRGHHQRLRRAVEPAGHGGRAVLADATHERAGHGQLVGRVRGVVNDVERVGEMHGHVRLAGLEHGMPEGQDALVADPRRGARGEDVQVTAGEHRREVAAAHGRSAATR